MWTLIGGIAAAAVLILGAYSTGRSGGYDSGYSDGDKTGYLRGVTDIQKLNDAAMLALMAESRAQAAIIQQEASDHANAVQALQQSAIESARVQYATDTARVSADAERLRQRLRDAEVAARSALRRAERDSRLPEIAVTAARIDGPTFTDWIFHDRGGQALVRLAERADWINAQYQICHRAFPRPTDQ